MPKINVYLPDDLATAVREAGIPVSSVCQRALADAVAAVDGRGGFRASADDSEFELPNLSRMTQRAQKILAIAQESADAHGRTTSSPDIVSALLEEGHNLALTVLAALDVDPADLYQECRAIEATRLRAGESEPESDAPTVVEILGRSADEALALEHNYIGSEHLLLGIAAGPATDPTVAALRTLGIDLAAMRGATRAALAGMTYAQANVYTTALSAPVRSILDEIRQRLGRLEDAKRSR